MQLAFRATVENLETAGLKSRNSGLFLLWMLYNRPAFKLVIRAKEETNFVWLTTENLYLSETKQRHNAELSLPLRLQQMCQFFYVCRKSKPSNEHRALSKSSHDKQSIWQTVPSLDSRMTRTNRCSLYLIICKPPAAPYEVFKMVTVKTTSLILKPASAAYCKWLWVIIWGRTASVHQEHNGVMLHSQHRRQIVKIKVYKNNLLN